MDARAAIALSLLLAGCPGSPDPGSAPTRADPAPVVSVSPAVAQASATLERLVDARCLDPAEPWALIHGLIVRGVDLRVGGELAVDRFVRDNLLPEQLRFPAQRAGKKVEPHPSYFAKNALELGLPLERRFGDGPTLAELALAQARAYAPATQPVPFFDEEWRLELVAATAALDPAQAERLPRLRDAALAALVENQAYFEPWRADPLRPFEKASAPGPDGRPRPGAIHRYACGGFHFFQAVQRLHGTAVPPALARQYELLRVRLVVEDRYWEEKLAQARARAEGARRRQHEEVILAQRLKLLGHGLETWLRAAAIGAVTLGPEERREVERALERLAATTLELERLSILAELDALRAREPQLYLDLVGDAAHALHALGLWRTSVPPLTGR